MPSDALYRDVAVLESRVDDHGRRLDDLEDTAPAVIASKVDEMRDEVKHLKRWAIGLVGLLIVGLASLLVQHISPDAVSGALHVLFGSA